MTEEIINGNKLIAEFMGYEHDELEDDDDITTTYYCHDKLENLSGKEPWETTEDDWSSWLRWDEMKFHKSWDWLIPVVNKIYTSEEYYQYEQTLSEFDDEGVSINTTYILETYRDVVDYIKWFNNKEK